MNNGNLTDATEERGMEKTAETEISIVIPVFEELGAIAGLVDAVHHNLQPLGRTFEVIVVDDGSGDGTLDVLKELLDRYPGTLHIGRHLVNRGNGAALRTGIRLARGELVITMDADGQHDPADIPRLLESIPPYDLVIAARTGVYQGQWYRNMANRFYNRFASWLTRARIEDLTSGFRAMRRQAVLHFLPLFPNGFSAPTTTTMAFLKAGYNVKFVPIHVAQRRSGKSKIRLWEDGSRFFIIILRMIMLYDPLRIFLPMGFFLALLGLAAWIAGLVNADRLVFPNSTIFLFSSALLTWLLGLVSDQVSNTRLHYYGDETILQYGRAKR